MTADIEERESRAIVARNAARDLNNRIARERAADLDDAIMEADKLVAVQQSLIEAMTAELDARCASRALSLYSGEIPVTEEALATEVNLLERFNARRRGLLSVKHLVKGNSQ